MYFSRQKKFSQVRPSNQQIAWCKKLGANVTGDMDRKDVVRLIDRTQARLVKTLLQTAGIREGSVVQCHFANRDPEMCVVTRFFEMSTWIRLLERNGRRHNLSTANFDNDPPTLNYQLVYTGPPEWTHALSVVPRFASEMKTDPLRKRTDALHAYLQQHLAAGHKMMHEVYGEYWSTDEVARLKTLFEEALPEE